MLLTYILPPPWFPSIAMFVRSVLLGGAAALGASAMLVVPEMEPKVDMIEDGFVNVHPMLLEDVHHAIVDLPCSECPLRETNDEGVVTWAEGKPSSLVSMIESVYSFELANRPR